MSTKGNTSQLRCYTCGAVGHVRKDCPDRGLAGPKESRGKSSGQSQVATIVRTGVHAEGTMDAEAVEVDPVD